MILSPNRTILVPKTRLENQPSFSVLYVRNDNSNSVLIRLSVAQTRIIMECISQKRVESIRSFKAPFALGWIVNSHDLHHRFFCSKVDIISHENRHIHDDCELTMIDHFFGFLTNPNRLSYAMIVEEKSNPKFQSDLSILESGSRWILRDSEPQGLGFRVSRSKISKRHSPMGRGQSGYRHCAPKQAESPDSQKFIYSGNFVPRT